MFCLFDLSFQNLSKVVQLRKYKLRCSTCVALLFFAGGAKFKTAYLLVKKTVLKIENFKLRYIGEYFY